MINFRVYDSSFMQIRRKKNLVYDLLHTCLMLGKLFESKFD